MNVEDVKKILDHAFLAAGNLPFLNGGSRDEFAQAVLDRLPATMRQMREEELASALKQAITEAGWDVSETQNNIKHFRNVANNLHPILFPPRKVWGHPDNGCYQNWWSNEKALEYAGANYCPNCGVKLEREPKSVTVWLNVYECSAIAYNAEARAQQFGATSPGVLVIAHPVTIEIPEGK